MKYLKQRDPTWTKNVPIFLNFKVRFWICGFQIQGQVRRLDF